MKTFKLLLAALLVRSAYAEEYKQEQNEYLINQMTKEEYKQIEKKVLEKLAERKNMWYNKIVRRDKREVIMEKIFYFELD